MQNQSTATKIGSKLQYNRIIRNRESQQTPTFCSNKSQSFNKDNQPYSNSLKMVNLTALNEYNCNTQQHKNNNEHLQSNRHCESYRQHQCQSYTAKPNINTNFNNNLHSNRKVKGNGIVECLQTQYIDSVNVDYREKTFELMRKNAQLELTIKQSKTDTANLEQEIEHLTQLIKQIIQLVGIGNSKSNPMSSNILNSNISNSNEEQNASMPQEEEKSYMANLITIKQMLNSNNTYNNNNNNNNNNIHNNSSNINSDNNNKQVSSTLNSRLIHSIMPVTTSNYNETLRDQKLHNLLNATNKLNNNHSINETTKSNYVAQCNCEQHFNKIIVQYKTMIQAMHNKAVKKERTNRALQQQLQKCKQQIQQLKQQATQSQSLEVQLCKKQTVILELAKKNKQFQLDIKSKESQIVEINKVLTELQQNSKQKQENIQKISKLQADLKELNEKYQDILRAVEEKQKSVQGLVAQNEELFKEKQKMKQRYKQEFIHFEEMSKLVEEKLIEVEYEMNFYKKERNENFDKISRLEGQLKQYKANQQKKYYSFGHSQRDVEVQVFPNDLEADYEMHQSIAEIIVDGSKSQASSNGNSDECTTKSFKRKISLDFTVIKEVPQQDSPRRLNCEKDNWQMECYEQSIKTLLNQNSRLKKSLLKLYKLKGNETEVSKQIELQLKILLSTMPSNEQNEIEETNEDEDGYITLKKQ